MIPLVIIVVCHFPPRIVIMTSTAVETVPDLYRRLVAQPLSPVTNLNGLYLNGKNDHKGMDWQSWKKTHYSVKKSEMKIRPKDF